MDNNDKVTTSSVANSNLSNQKANKVNSAKSLFARLFTKRVKLGLYIIIVVDLFVYYFGYRLNWDFKQINFPSFSLGVIVLHVASTIGASRRIRTEP